MKKKQDIVFTQYRDTDKWTIVNDFTIHGDRELSDRPFILGKVPKQLWLDLKDTRVVDAYDWSGAFWVGEMAVNDDGNLVADKETEDGEPKYTQEPYITARAEIEDKITVFSVEEGALLQFDEIALIGISPTPIGKKIGGKANATTWQSIEFSGMSSKDVPGKGLMEGEPGRLWLNTDPFPDEEPNLQLKLYLDEPQFKDLFSTLLANSEKVEKTTMNTVIELFENEMQAELNEPWMTSEYGLLKRDDRDRVSGRARIDGISITYSRPMPVLSPADDRLAKTMHSVRARLDWVIGLLVLLIVSLVAAI